MCGLCGNFNNNINDEFLTKNLKKHATLDRFSNSFKVGQNKFCPRSKSVRKNLNSRYCAGSTWNQKIAATQICNRITKQYFVCPGYADPFQQCMSDICSCRDHIQCQCYALENFIKGCNLKNHNKQTQISMCSSHQYLCSKGSEFKFCSYNCKKTCKNRNQTPTNCHRRSCKPGCECIGNRVWYKQQCIPEVMCP